MILEAIKSNVSLQLMVRVPSKKSCKCNAIIEIANQESSILKSFHIILLSPIIAFIDLAMTMWSPLGTIAECIVLHNV